MTAETQDDEPVEEGSRRAYKPRYDVSGVPLAYDAQVQLAAVLRAFDPRVRSTPRRIVDATARVCQRWRILATKLAEAGWTPLAGVGPRAQLGNALVCPPAFVMTSQKSARKDKPGGRRTNCCHLRQLCPFCWAREVRRYWLKVEPAFFPKSKTGPQANLTGKKNKERKRPVDTDMPSPVTHSVTGDGTRGKALSPSPYDLVYRAFSFSVPARGWRHLANVVVVDADGVEVPVPGAGIVKDGLATWLDARIRGGPHARTHRLPETRALLRAAGPGGGVIEAIQIYPGPVDTTGLVWWEVQVHQLVLAVNGHALSRKINELSEVDCRTHRVFRHPTRRTVAQLMGWVFRYPRFLLDPATPVAKVVEYLDARKGRRLVVSCGAFRSRTRSRK